MKHLSNFSMFNEKHLYGKSMATSSKKWPESFSALIKYLKKQIEERQVKDFTNTNGNISFTIKGRKYKIDKDKKICLYKAERVPSTEKGKKGDLIEKEIKIDLTKENIEEILSALKKPLKSTKAAESSKKHPEGRKPYLSED